MIEIRATDEIKGSQKITADESLRNARLSAYQQLNLAFR